MDRFEFDTMLYCVAFLMLLLDVGDFVDVSNADAKWTEWSAWDECSATCGYGVRSRERTCFGADCPVRIDKRFMSCSMRGCEEVSWNGWGSWNECTALCSGGTQVRSRTCRTGNDEDCCSYRNKHNDCPDEREQQRSCNTNPCNPPNGIWGEWKPWSACSAVCGSGREYRFRDCFPVGSTCIGNNNQDRACFTSCVDDGKVVQDSLDWLNDPCVAQSCENNGTCINLKNGKTTCKCQGNWRGIHCSQECRMEINLSSCAGKDGVYHVCEDCTKYMVCVMGQRVIFNCPDGELWTGNRCEKMVDSEIKCVNT